MDALANGWGDSAGNPDDHFARRQFPWSGADGRRTVLLRADAINVCFGADPLDRLHCQIQGQAARRRFRCQHQVLRADSENAVVAGRLKSTRVIAAASGSSAASR